MIIERDMWDAAVIGAGPAGSVAAMQLARGGARVLLIDKARFPRDKVCGCCVNATAVAMLESLGLGDRLRQLDHQPTHRFRMHTAGRSCTLPLSGGLAVSRAAFDQMLAAAAQEAGAVLLDGVAARVPPRQPARLHRIIALERGDQMQTIGARIVLACSGLGRLVDDEPGMAPRIAGGSYIGCAAIADGGPEIYEAGTIHMVHGRGGYVGLVRIEGGRLDVAAALDPALVKTAGGPGAAVDGLLNSAALAVLGPLKWRGAPLLSRRRDSVASDRLLALGDAAGYVEPFTGEGIAWAIASAQAAAPCALAAIKAWDPSLAARWNREHRRLLHDRQRRCRWLTRALRPPIIARVLNRLLAGLPSLARPMLRAIHRPWPQLAALQALPAPSGARP